VSWQLDAVAVAAAVVQVCCLQRSPSTQANRAEIAVTTRATEIRAKTVAIRATEIQAKAVTIQAQTMAIQASVVVIQAHTMAMDMTAVRTVLVVTTTAHQAAEAQAAVPLGYRVF
jgi:hypothetical protein